MNFIWNLTITLCWDFFDDDDDDEDVDEDDDDDDDDDDGWSVSIVLTR